MFQKIHNRTASQQPSLEGGGCGDGWPVSRQALGKRAERGPPAAAPAHPAGSHRSAGAAVGMKRGPARPLLAVRHLGFHRCPEYLWGAPTKPQGFYSSVVPDSKMLGTILSACALWDPHTTQPSPGSTRHYPVPVLQSRSSLRTHTHARAHTHARTHTHECAHTHMHAHTHTRVFWAAPRLLIRLMTILKHMLTITAPKCFRTNLIFLVFWFRATLPSVSPLASAESPVDHSSGRIPQPPWAGEPGTSLNTISTVVKMQFVNGQTQSSLLWQKPGEEQKSRRKPPLP